VSILETIERPLKTLAAQRHCSVIEDNLSFDFAPLSQRKRAFFAVTVRKAADHAVK